MLELGTHLIVDIENIGNYQLLETLEGIAPLMTTIVDKCKLNVKKGCSHQFSPVGCTMLYLLAESHLSITHFQNIVPVPLTYLPVILILILA